MQPEKIYESIHDRNTKVQALLWKLRYKRYYENQGTTITTTIKI